MFSIPWEKSVWIVHVGTITRLFGILAFAAGTAVAIRRRSVRIPNLAIIVATVLVAWSMLTFFWTLDQHATALRARTLLELLAMLWLIWDECRGPVRQRQVMHAYVLGAAVASVIAFSRYFNHQQTNYRRYAATGFDPNDFGLILALAIPLALYLALQNRDLALQNRDLGPQKRGWMQWYFYGLALTIILAIFLTASRTTLIATFVAFGFAIATWGTATVSQKIASATLLAVLPLGMLPYGPTPQRQRLATLPAELSHGTFHDRTRIWRAGLVTLKNHALLGVGAGAYPEAVRPILGTPADSRFQFVAHNTFLSVLVETGAIGFSLYALLLASLVLFIWMMPGTERALWSVMLAAWAVGVSTLTWEHYKPSWLIMALIMTEWARCYWPAPSDQ